MAHGHFLTSAQATAQVFMTAFMALPPSVQNRVVTEMVRDKRLREDLVDLAIAEARSREPSRPLRKFLAEAERSR